MRLLYLVLFIIVPCSMLLAAEDYYQFSTPKAKERFETLTAELRCLVCQNQNIAESNAALAQDLRDIIYQKIQQGQSDKDIIHYLVERYGDFVRYRPPFNKITFGLWLGPFLLLIMSVSYLLYFIYRKRREQ